MELQITVKNLDLSPAIEEQIRKKSEKLEKYERANFSLSWVCTHENDKHLVEAKLVGANLSLYASKETENLYKSIDLVSSKLEKQLRKHKSKVRLGIRKIASLFVRKSKDEKSSDLSS